MYLCDKPQSCSVSCEELRLPDMEILVLKGFGVDISVNTVRIWKFVFD